MATRIGSTERFFRPGKRGKDRPSPTRSSLPNREEGNRLGSHLETERTNGKVSHKPPV